MRCLLEQRGIYWHWHPAISHQARYEQTPSGLSIYAILDAKKVTPKCAAVNLAGLPLTPSSSNIGPYPAAVNNTVALLQSSIGNIRHQMVKVVAKLDELKTGQPEMRTIALSYSSPNVDMQSSCWQPGPTETVTSSDCLSIAAGQSVEHPGPGNRHCGQWKLNKLLLTLNHSVTKATFWKAAHSLLVQLWR